MVRFGSVRLDTVCSLNEAKGVWPNSPRHVICLIRTSQRSGRDESDPTKAMFSPYHNSDVTGRFESDAERSEWIGLSGYVKRYKRSVRRTAYYSGGRIRFDSVLFGSVRFSV